VAAPELAGDLRPDGEDVLARLREACGERHEISIHPAPLEEYGASGLPSTTMGREVASDRLFFASALAAGDALAAAARVGVPG